MLPVYHCTTYLVIVQMSINLLQLVVIFTPQPITLDYLSLIVIVNIVLLSSLYGCMGPYNTKTFVGNRFFLTIVDDYSRITQVFLLKFKSDMLIMLKQYLKLIQTQFKALVQVVITDNVGEFTSNLMQDFFINLGIVYHRTCLYPSLEQCG